MDPQQRLFLEVAWKAWSGPAIDPKGWRPPGSSSGRPPLIIALLAAGSASPLDPHRYSGTTLSMVATRTSYLLNLKGPSLTVNTACLFVDGHPPGLPEPVCGRVALAIAGGVNLILDLAGTQMLVEGGMLSRPGGREPSTSGPMGLREKEWPRCC